MLNVFYFLYLEHVVIVFFLLLENVAAPIQVNRQKIQMTEEVRKQVYQALLARSKNGKLGKKDTTIV